MQFAILALHDIRLMDWLSPWALFAALIYLDQPYKPSISGWTQAPALTVNVQEALRATVDAMKVLPLLAQVAIMIMDAIQAAISRPRRRLLHHPLRHRL